VKICGESCINIGPWRHGNIGNNQSEAVAYRIQPINDCGQRSESWLAMLMAA